MAIHPVGHPQLAQTGRKMKYIVVMGGIIGGVGKGVIASSLGTLLDGAGLNVTFIKIDPHITLNKNLSRKYIHEINGILLTL